MLKIIYQLSLTIFQLTSFYTAANLRHMVPFLFLHTIQTSIQDVVHIYLHYSNQFLFLMTITERIVVVVVVVVVVFLVAVDYSTTVQRMMPMVMR